MEIRKRVALVAHDNKKEDLLDWARFNQGTLSRHELLGTGTTGKLIHDRLGLDVQRLLSGPLGGDQQLGAMIAEGKLDVLIFFWDPLEPQPHDTDVKALLRIAVLYNIPTACNRATADFIVSSHLMAETYGGPLVAVGRAGGQAGGLTEPVDPGHPLLVDCRRAWTSPSPRSRSSSWPPSWPGRWTPSPAGAASSRCRPCSRPGSRPRSRSAPTRGRASSAPGRRCSATPGPGSWTGAWRGSPSRPASSGRSAARRWCCSCRRPLLRPVVLGLLVVVAVGAGLPAGRPAPRPRASAHRSLAVAAAIALVIGAYDGFFGPGTGTFLIFALRDSSSAPACARPRPTPRW